MNKYNTNLASEFYVLSMLYRIGAEASLTLGNKKSVDIIVSLSESKTLTMDVKGLAAPYDWPADNIRLPAADTHYIVLVSFDRKMADPLYAPNVWIVPANDLKDFIKQFRTRKDVSRALILKNGAKYLNNWNVFVPAIDEE